MLLLPLDVTPTSGCDSYLRLWLLPLDVTPTSGCYSYLWMWLLWMWLLPLDVTPTSVSIFSVFALFLACLHYSFPPFPLYVCVYLSVCRPVLCVSLIVCPPARRQWSLYIMRPKWNERRCRTLFALTETFPGDCYTRRSCTHKIDDPSSLWSRWWPNGDKKF